MISLLINMKPRLFSQFSNINYLQEANEVTMKTSSNYQKQFKSYFNIFCKLQVLIPEFIDWMETPASRIKWHVIMFFPFS